MAGYQSQLAKVSTWLVSITRHRAIDELRKRHVRPEKELVEWTQGDSSELLDRLIEAGSPERSLENELESRIQEEDVRQVLALLLADQQQVLGLAYFKGMSQSQIAIFLGEPLGTVKSRVRLAMVKLRDSFLEQGMMDI